MPRNTAVIEGINDASSPTRSKIGFGEEIYYTTTIAQNSDDHLLEDDTNLLEDDGELENEHLPHSFSTSSNIHHHQHHDSLISPSSPTTDNFHQQDFLASIHSGPTIDSMSIDEEERQQKEYNDDIENGGKKPSIMSRLWILLTGTVIAHLMIWTNLTFFSGFLILSPYGLKIYNPIIFSFFRGIVLVISMFPIMLLVDRKFKFKSETKLIKRAFNFRKQYPSIYGSKYWGWIYSIFYDDKAVIPSLIWSRIPSYKLAKQLAWCGTLVVLNSLLFVAGLQLTNSTITGAIQPLVAIMVCVISMAIGRESKSYVKFFGSLVASVGAISMLFASALSKDTVNHYAMEPDTFQNLSPFEKLPEYFSLLAPVGPSRFAFILGLLALLGNTLSYSLFLVNQKTLLDKGVPPLTLTFWAFFFGLGISFLSSLYFLPSFNYRRVDTRAIISVLYAAIPYGAVQFSLSSSASKILGATIVGVYSTVAPLVAILTGVFVFGESPSPWILVGAALILFGVFVVIGQRYVENRNKSKQATQDSENQELETANDLEDKSISSTQFSSSAANFDEGITPSSSSNFQDVYNEESPNFKSL